MTTWREGDLHTDHATLHLYRTGTLGKPAVLLAHGLSDNGTCWWQVADALGADHDIVAFDARNHGRSSTSAASAQRLVDDLATIIDEVELVSPTLIGHSVGARTMAEFVAHHPGVASRLVLIDPPWTANQEHDAATPPERRAVIHEWLAGLAGASEPELAELVAAEHPDWPSTEHASWIASKQQVRSEAAAALDGRGWGSVAADLDCPTLLLRGEVARGGILTDEVAQRVADVNEHITVRQISNAGHHAHRENFDECIAAIRDFIAAT